MENAKEIGNYIGKNIDGISGKGLLLGLHLENKKEVTEKLFDNKIITGVAIIRIELGFYLH